MVSSRSQIKTLSVVDSGVVGETVFVRRPRPLVPRDSDPILPTDSLDRLAVSDFNGDVEPSARATPLEVFSAIFLEMMVWSNKIIYFLNSHHLHLHWCRCKGIVSFYFVFKNKFIIIMFVF